MCLVTCVDVYYRLHNTWHSFPIWDNASIQSSVILCMHGWFQAPKVCRQSRSGRRLRDDCHRGTLKVPLDCVELTCCSYSSRLSLLIDETLGTVVENSWSESFVPFLLCSKVKIYTVLSDREVDKRLKDWLTHWDFSFFVPVLSFKGCKRYSKNGSDAIFRLRTTTNSWCIPE